MSLRAWIDARIPVDGTGDRALRAGMTLVMVGIGVLHLIVPAEFERVIPPFFPARHALAVISGVFEILGGVGLWVPATRRFSAYGLMALLLAVFPANIYMAVAHISPGGVEQPLWALWARLPFQGVFLAWAWLSTRR